MGFYNTQAVTVLSMCNDVDSYALLTENLCIMLNDKKKRKIQEKIKFFTSWSVY